MIALIANEYKVTLSKYELLRALGTALFEKRYLSDVIKEMDIKGMHISDTNNYDTTLSIF